MRLGIGAALELVETLGNHPELEYGFRRVLESPDECAQFLLLQRDERVIEQLLAPFATGYWNDAGDVLRTLRATAYDLLRDATKMVQPADPSSINPLKES